MARTCSRAEVEELLAGHEAIEEAAAIGVDDEKFGQRLKAFVVLRDGAELSEDEVKGYVKENLASYKVPARGRVHRRAAAKPDRQGAQARARRAGRRFREGQHRVKASSKGKSS